MAVTVTAQLLVTATGCTQEIARALERGMADACAKFDINTGARLADFLAQTAHESSDYTRRVENLNYTASRLTAVWPKRFHTLDDAKPYAQNPPALANFVYADRMGNSQTGDGWRYRGRGFLQVTGRENYREVTRLLREADVVCPDFIIDPDALSEPRWAAMSAAALWQHWDLNELADAGEFTKQTIKINGGTNGLEDRLKRRARARAALLGSHA
jgi:putative chitinase